MTRGPNAITRTVETAPLLVPTDMASEAVDIVMELASYGGHVLVVNPEGVKTIQALAKRIQTFNRQHRDLADQHHKEG